MVTSVIYILISIPDKGKKMDDKIIVEFSRVELQQRCKNKEFFRFGAYRCIGCDGSDERLIACHLDFKTSFKINNREEQKC